MVANSPPLAKRSLADGGATTEWIAPTGRAALSRKGEVVVTDVGGTHARFAIAEIGDGGAIRLGPTTTLRAADYPDIEGAWAAFAATAGRTLPKAAALAVACPTDGPVLKLTNNHWRIAPAATSRALELEQFTVINDLAAIGHAMAHLSPEDFVHLCGPESALPQDGVISVIGLGTGLGVAHVVRKNGTSFVSATEGGHVNFAPADTFEDELLKRLRLQFGRVSVERVVSGPGLSGIYDTLAAQSGGGATWDSNGDLWTAALTGEDALAESALDRFCLALGSAAGDIALVHGASSVVIAGGLAQRLKSRLNKDRFRERFTAKGRFEALMQSISVKIATHPQPGLLGAAAAFDLQQ